MKRDTEDNEFQHKVSVTTEQPKGKWFVNFQEEKICERLFPTSQLWKRNFLPD